MSSKIKLKHKLQEVRKKIDEIDTRLRELVAQRIKLLDKIAKVKSKLHIGVYDEKRELKIINNAVRHANQIGLDPIFAQSLMKVLINYTRRKERVLHRIYKKKILKRKLIVGILGPRGTFTEDAAMAYFPAAIELKSFQTIPEIFDAVEEGEISHGVVAIENSLEGSIGITLDSLLETDAKISGEIILPVIHCLAAKPGTKLENIKTIISHPHALAQVQQFIKNKFPKIELRQGLSTAEAAKFVSQSKSKNIAAICSKTAAKLYGLNVLAENIQEGDNITRFIILSKFDQKFTGDDKTSIVFGLKANRPGELYKILKEFAIRNINLTKIESRPSKRALGDYFFFVDMEGHAQERVIAEAFKNVRKKIAFLKVLGSYPKSK